jgi:hypothetical protein
MDAAELTRIKDEIESDDYWLARPQLERRENWRTIAGEMPYLRFPRDWEVAVVPPFGGAVARFWVRKGAAQVSVYADYYERLGCWSEPHWEIYPSAEDDNERFSIATESDEMLKAITKSLAKQARKASAMSAGTAETQSGSGPQDRQRDGEAETPKGGSHA